MTWKEKVKHGKGTERKVGGIILDRRIREGLFEKVIFFPGIETPGDIHTTHSNYLPYQKIGNEKL